MERPKPGFVYKGVILRRVSISIRPSPSLYDMLPREAFSRLRHATDVACGVSTSSQLISRASSSMAR